MSQKPEEMDVNNGKSEMLTHEDILAAVELHSMQFIQLSSHQKCQIDIITQSNLRRDQSPLQKRETVAVNIPPVPVLVLPDGYVPPTIPQVRGLLGLITNCSIPFEKQLTETDLSEKQNRLSFNKQDAEQFLLPMVKMSDLRAGINTVVYDMNGNTYPMIFKYWSNKYYVLSIGWKAFYNYDGKCVLKALEDFVTVWMFQHGVSKKLCFALSIRRCSNVHHLIKRNRNG